MGEGEVVLMTQKTGDGEREGVAFMKNKETGEMILPVFSSTLEVFRHNPDGGSVMVPLASLRTTVKPGMGIVIDPASPEAVELPSAELEKVGYFQG